MKSKQDVKEATLPVYLTSRSVELLEVDLYSSAKTIVGFVMPAVQGLVVHKQEKKHVHFVISLDSLPQKVYANLILSDDDVL